MARVNFRLPDIGEGIAEAEIVTWHIQVGDMVEEDQPVADMMTDKATVEMAAPVTGRVIEIAGAVGDQIAIGSTLVVFETDGEAGAAEATASALGDGPEAADATPPADAAVTPVPRAVEPEETRSSRAQSRDVPQEPASTVGAAPSLGTKGGW